MNARAFSRWRPAPVVVVSGVLHVAAVIAFAVRPDLWPWLLGLLAAKHLFLGALALVPRGGMFGPNIVRRGLRYVSWPRRGLDEVDNDPGRVFNRMADGLDAGDILLLHDAARARTGASTLLNVLPRLLGELSVRGLASVPLPEAFREV